jgi:hypothetical protein
MIVVGVICIQNCRCRSDEKDASLLHGKAEDSSHASAKEREKLEDSVKDATVIPICRLIKVHAKIWKRIRRETLTLVQSSYGRREEECYLRRFWHFAAESGTNYIVGAKGLEQFLVQQKLILL